MIAGRLNEPIKVFKAVETLNEYGEKTTDYVLVDETRARVEWNSGNRDVENDEIVYNWTKSFTVRSYVQVEETGIIEWQKKRYRILSIEKRREWNDQLVMTELINE